MRKEATNGRWSDTSVRNFSRPISIVQCIGQWIWVEKNFALKYPTIFRLLPLFALTEAEISQVFYRQIYYSKNLPEVTTYENQ